MAEEVNNISTWPLLSTIDSPADLRRLPQEKLPTVCSELRSFLIDSLSRNPGHFASSMGAVELTVALHYVFNTPYDRIVWDVGHQAYGHKILTGRRDRFATNRRLNGLSGFPNPDESEYDTFSAGHASNSISAALGMAVATEMNDDHPRRNVVAVIGDASISGGMAFEGLNNAANTPNNLLIILNDNDMSIDANVGSLHSYLAQITTSRGYNNLRFRLYNLLKGMNLVSDRKKGQIMRLNNSLKSLFTGQQNIFEGLNIRYFGPVNGHDLDQLVKVLRDIKDMKGPRILHVKTKKGKGFAPAEADPSTWHAPGKFDPATGALASSNASGPKPAKYQEVFGETLLELAKADRRIVGITAAMPTGTSMNILGDALPGRVFDVGISEEHAVTFAGGLAREGLRPYVAIYSAFLQRAYDQIINDVALQRLPVTLCIDRAGLVGEDGATHHGAFDLAYLSSVPGLVVAAPRNEAMLRNLLYTSLHREPAGPMAIRYPRGAGESPDWRTPMHRLEIGKGEILTEGSDAVILSIGTIAAEVSRAVNQLAFVGLSVAHFDMTFLKPLDAGLLQDAASRGVPIITAEDGTVEGGLGSAVAQWLAENGISRSLRVIGIPDKFVAQGSVSQLRKLCGLDADSIAQAVKAEIEKAAETADENIQPFNTQTR